MKNYFKNKNYCYWAHGFKGSWLYWLYLMGAKVIGISKDIPSKPSLYA